MKISWLSIDMNKYKSPLEPPFDPGWAEVTIVVRFWLIAGFLAFAGAGLFYLEWLGR